MFQCLYLYFRLRSNYQEGKVEIHLTALTLSRSCTCPQAGPWFLMLCVVFFLRSMVCGERRMFVLLILVELLNWPSLFKLSFHNTGYMKIKCYLKLNRFCPLGRTGQSLQMDSARIHHRIYIYCDKQFVANK